MAKQGLNGKDMRLMSPHSLPPSQDHQYDHLKMMMMMMRMMTMKITMMMIQCISGEYEVLTGGGWVSATNYLSIFFEDFPDLAHKMFLAQNTLDSHYLPLVFQAVHCSRAQSRRRSRETDRNHLD